MFEPEVMKSQIKVAAKNLQSLIDMDCNQGYWFSNFVGVVKEQLTMITEILEAFPQREATENKLVFGVGLRDNYYKPSPDNSIREGAE